MNEIYCLNKHLNQVYFRNIIRTEIIYNWLIRSSVSVKTILEIITLLINYNIAFALISFGFIDKI